jgi:hypothetical protein
MNIKNGEIMLDENEKESKITIVFDSYGSVIFTSQFQNVNPMQLLALSQYLEFEGKSALQAAKIQAMMNREEQNKPKIEVPDSILVPRK